MDLKWIIDEVSIQLKNKAVEIEDLNYGDSLMLVELADNSIDRETLYGYVVNRFDPSITFDDAESEFDDIVDEVKYELQLEVNTDYTLEIDYDEDLNYGVIVTK